jgi:hypothetical protein
MPGFNPFPEKLFRNLASILAVSCLLFLIACGGASSSSRVQVQTGPSINQQPVGPSIKTGQTATLTISASGNGSLTYQWYQGPSGTTSNAISGATTNSYTTPVLTATTSYWVQVTDSTGNTNSNTAVVLIAGPRQVQALLHSSAPSSGGITVKLPGAFLSSVLPHISGIAVSMPWSFIETSNATGDGSGGYDFSAFDAALQPFYAQGRAVNLIVWPATEGGDNDPSNGGSTPSYVFSAGYASAVGASNPEDMAVCPSYSGDSSGPFYSSTQSGNGGGGSWNVTTSSDLSGIPVSYELPFMTAYQNFIVQVIQHYNGNTATPIGYIRFGFSEGGENSPLCNQFWPGYSDATYLGYVQTMTNFVKQQNPQMTILEDLHSLGQESSESASTYTQYPVAESADAMTDSFGFGTNGLQASDITNFAANQPCDADWCNLFTPAGGFGYNATLSLQTLQWTDPTGQDTTNPTGSLTAIEPFAKAHAANNLELYEADLGLAFDAANYASYPNAYTNINATTYSSSYASAIQDFLNP